MSSPRDSFESIAERLNTLRDDIQAFADRTLFERTETRSGVIAAGRNVAHAGLMWAATYEHEKQPTPSGEHSTQRGQKETIDNGNSTR